VDRVLCKKPEKNWFLLKTSIGICKGVVSWDPQMGDLLRLEGAWQISSFNGANEFVFKCALPDIPEDSRALLNYAITITKGMGLAAEALIWEKYGDKWQEIQEPEVPRITEETLFNWQDTLRRLDQHRAKSATLAALMAKGCTLNMSAAAFEKWEEQAYAIVAKDPYQLAELPHYGFSAVDGDIRRAFGIEDNDIRRLDAAVLYVLGKVGDQGNTLADIVEVREEILKICADCSDRLEDSLSRLVMAEKISIFAPTSVCLIEDWRNEKLIWERFAKEKEAAGAA
jgi:hypothetical protein